MALLNPNTGAQDITKQRGPKGAMKTFDDSPPAVATSTMGVGRAAFKTTHAELPTMRVQLHYDVPWHQLSAIEHNILAMPAKHKTAWLL